VKSFPHSGKLSFKKENFESIKTERFCVVNQAGNNEEASIVAKGESVPSWLKTLRSILPILASAFCAAAIMYPLDLVGALQMSNAGSGLTTGQLLANFKNAHGWTGFFTQGLAPELARSTWMRFVKFALFPVVHLALMKIPEKSGNELSKAVAAIIASLPEALSIMPLEISKIALQLDTKNIYKNNMFTAMQSVFQRQGLSGFLVGYLGVQYRQAAWSAGYFASIKFFEKKVAQLLAVNDFDKKNAKVSKTLSQLLSGFFAGVFGACLNTPGDTIRSTLQKRVLSAVASGSKLAVNPTFFSVGKEIVAAKGVSALYAGFGFKAFHLGGSGALMAFLIPFFKQVFKSEK
jgi:solute carrier family 25 (mitochondrial 2-oxodicarboxylate transporter), member 21